MADSHGCTTIQGSCLTTNGTARACLEYGGENAQVLMALMNACKMTGEGVWSTSPCDKTGAVGGCVAVSPGACQATWDFPPADASSVKSDCAGPDQTFVTPPLSRSSLAPRRGFEHRVSRDGQAAPDQRDSLLKKDQIWSVSSMKLLLLPTMAFPMAPPPVPQSELPNQQWPPSAIEQPVTSVCGQVEQPA